jgi:2-C-methyl-D-erythritol 4-phosphate cytidylyltransferase
MKIALVLACGRGERMGSDLPKQYIPIAEKPLLSWTFEALSHSPLIDRILPVIHPDDLALYDTLNISSKKIMDPVFGGKSRFESTFQGLKAIKPLNPATVLIHDGVRPFLTMDFLARLLHPLDDRGAIPVLPMQDTVRRIEEGAATDIDRANLYRIQTPQVFPYLKLLEAFERFAASANTLSSRAQPGSLNLSHPELDAGSHRGKRFRIESGMTMFFRDHNDDSSSLPFIPTDDASIFSWAGHELTYIEGCPLNIKATTPQDLKTLTWLLTKKDLP